MVMTDIGTTDVMNRTDQSFS